MSDNPRIAMPFGSGLDRDTGIMVVRPGTFEDIRNVLLHQGKALVRPGFGSPLELLDDLSNPISDVVAGFPLRSEQVGIVASYQSSTQKVWVHRIDAEGLTATLIAEWVNDKVTASRPTGWGETAPRVSMAESYGNVFMAHDTRLVGERAKTIYYQGGSLNDLTGDFVGAGVHDLRFRGVVRHLNYLFGWGYGDEVTDRPELVRSSVAGDPTTFQPNHYSIAGDREDGVLLCLPAGGRLCVFKQSETHVIAGSSRADFGIKLLDPLYGILSSQAGANFARSALVWSLEGPRLFDGHGDSEEISIPLDLGGLEPSTLVPEGAAAIAFAHYVPDLRVVTFVFGRRVYALTVRIEGDWKWSYWALGFDPLCAFTLFAASFAAIAPTGFPEYSASVTAGTYSDVTIVHHDEDGDEILEAWVQEDPAGAWSLNNSDPVGSAGSQVIRANALTAGTVYNLAFRYRRGTLYTVGYENLPPSGWPSVSQGQITTIIDPPTLVSGVWTRESAIDEQILLTVTPAVGLEANDIEVFESAVSIGTISGPHVGDAEFIHNTAGGLAGEVTNDYTFETKGGTDSPPSAELTVYSGPPIPPTIDWYQGTGPAYEVGFTPGDGAIHTECWDNYDDAGGTGASALRQTANPGVESFLVTGLVNVPTTPGLSIAVKTRHKQTLFGIDDFSVYSLIYSVTIMDPWV